MTSSEDAAGAAAHVTTEQPVLLALYRYWAGSRCGRRFPRRRDIDPADIRRILQNVMLIAVEKPAAADGRPLRPVFRYRLIGTGVTRTAGYDLTGGSFDELPDRQFSAFCQTLFERALELGEPLSAHGRRLLHGEPWAFDSILLPLSEDGRTIDLFLTGLVYPEAWNGGAQPRPPWNWHTS